MPAVNLLPTPPPPDSNVTLNLSPKRQGLSSSHILHFALAVLTTAAVARLLIFRFLAGRSWSKCNETRPSRKDYRRRLLAPRLSGLAPGKKGAGPLHQQGRQLEQQAIWWITSPMMDEKSRGVSNNSAADVLDQKDHTSSPARDTWDSLTTPVRGSSDGGANAQIHTTMESSGWLSQSERGLAFEKANLPPSGNFAAASRSNALDFSTPRHFMTRPPPPPPLTPPSLSTRVYTFQDRRPSIAGSIPAELDALSPISFIHQPNPDYTASASSSADAGSSPSTPRRRSYAKTVPIGIPGSAPGQSIQDLSANLSPTKATFAPASFPSTLLPPPPPGHDDPADLDSEFPVGHGHGNQEIDMQGEIISVLDDAGAGWKRHTRVYGGAVCLACMASGGGGFYGATVPPEHRR